MNIEAGRSDVHVFLEWSISAGLSRESRRLPLSGTEACLAYYDIRLVEKFWSGSGEHLIYHFVAPDTESVRYIARRNSDRFDTLWLAAGDEQGAQTAYAAIYNAATGQRSALRDRVFVSENGRRLLALCALAEYAAEADETYAVRPEPLEQDYHSQYGVWRDCG
jgi:hypothetical protein